jgi:predicted Ser/Thr protein kinase
MKAGFGTGVAPEAGEPAHSANFIPPPVSDLAELFPQLDILELLGQGGMGAVYRARQPALDRLVALKILPPQLASGKSFAERFMREARALARLTHANIVAVHDFGQAGDFHYFVMEFVDGANLRQIERAGKLGPREALKIIPQICEALQFAHDEGIVHRDIKPENILVDKRGRVKIADFGIAKILGQAGDATLTGAKDVVGTPHYMAPEQVEKPQTVDHRADIYSLGVVFYEMLTGELPLGKFAPPSHKVEVDVRLDEVVLHALEKEPERRYQRASEVKTDVETIASSAAGSSGESRKPAASLQLPDSRALAVIAVVVLLLLTAWGNAIAMLTVSAMVLAGAFIVYGRGALRGGLLVAMAAFGGASVVAMGMIVAGLNSKERAHAGASHAEIDSPAGIASAVGPTDNPKTHDHAIPQAPPVVIRTIPESGVANVDPALSEIRVTFSKPMQDLSWSWSAWGEENFPETIGQPSYSPDGRTGVLPVKLEPGTVYALWLNSEHLHNFTDREGRPAVPYLLIFETRK